MTTIQLRRGVAALWTERNPVLADGEVGLETDTGKFKRGDGLTPWNSLTYNLVASPSAHATSHEAGGSDPVTANLADVTGTLPIANGGTGQTTASAALNALAEVTVTTAGKALWDDADAAAQRATLGLVIGTNVQAFDADLTTWAGVTPAAGVATFLATPSSANLATAVTDETGTGALVFGTSPQLTTPKLGTPSSGTLTNCVGLPTAGHLDASVTLAKMADLAQDQFIGRTTASTGVPQTATITSAARTVLDDTTVAAMVDTLGGAAATGGGGLVRATSPSLVTPALGTPSALVLTNATGLQLGLAWTPSNESVYWTDWQENATRWATNNGVGGASYSTPGSSGHPGVWRVSSGASIGGYSTSYDSTGSTTLWNATTQETLVNLSGNWGSGGKVRIGFSDGVAVADPTNGVFFEYAQDLSANWRIRSGKAGTYTTTTSSTAVTFSTWVKLKITWDGTTLTFYVNGSSVGTITTNVPTAVLAQAYFVTGNVAAGYTTCDVDYTFLRQSGLAR